MQSKTKSGFPERISSSEDESYSNTLASTWHSGKIAEKCFLRQTAFGIPTSARVATACRFNDESDTLTHVIKKKYIINNGKDQKLVSKFEWKPSPQ